MKHILTLVAAVLVAFPSAGFTQYNNVVYAVGDNSTILKLVDRYEWEVVPVESLPPCGDLISVWGSSDADIYVADGDHDLLHFDGTHWQSIALADPNACFINAVSGTGHDNVYAGGYGPGMSYPSGRAYHFNGYSWSAISGGGIINHMWADPDDGFYYIGNGYNELDRYWYDFVGSYRNAAWASEPLVPGSDPNSSREKEYYAISGCGSDHAFVAGYWVHLFVGGGGTIQYKENSTWQAMNELYPCDIFQFCPVLSTIYRAAYAVSDNEAWFAGENGMVLKYTPPWGRQEYNTQLPITFSAICVGPDGDVYVAGEYGNIICWNGSFWVVTNTNTAENINAMWVYHPEEPVAAQLQSFSTDVDGSGIAVRWSLSQMDESTRFRITRTALHESPAALVDDDPDLVREGLSFTYVDADVEPGGRYEYLVERSGSDGWHTLFESGAVSMPGAQLALHPNYPNPFNPTTAIAYSVPARGQVVIQVFDVSGTMVRTLLNEEQEPGRHTIHWNGLNDQGNPVASGTYFCRLTASKLTLSQKMLLLR